MQVAFYRIAQEALNNVVKHSQAKGVKISLLQSQEYIELRIVDDGKGFDTKQAAAGMGMGTMRERAEAIHARFNLTSNMGQGTEVNVNWKRQQNRNSA